MRKAILIVLSAFYLGACTEPAPPPPAPQTTTVHHHQVKGTTDNAEDFRAVEKPATYR
jgi:hypothetical protein